MHTFYNAIQSIHAIKSVEHFLVPLQSLSFGSIENMLFYNIIYRLIATKVIKQEFTIYCSWVYVGKCCCASVHVSVDVCLCLGVRSIVKSISCKYRARNSS